MALVCWGIYRQARNRKDQLKETQEVIWYDKSEDIYLAVFAQELFGVQEIRGALD